MRKLVIALIFTLSTLMIFPLFFVSAMRPDRPVVGVPEGTTLALDEWEIRLRSHFFLVHFDERFHIATHRSTEGGIFAGFNRLDGIYEFLRDAIRDIYVRDFTRNFGVQDRFWYAAAKNLVLDDGPGGSSPRGFLRLQFHETAYEWVGYEVYLRTGIRPRWAVHGAASSFLTIPVRDFAAFIHADVQWIPETRTLQMTTLPRGEGFFLPDVNPDHVVGGGWVDRLP